MRRSAIASALLLSLALPAAAEEAAKPAAPKAAAGALTTEGDKTLYALGLIISRNLSNLSLTPAELSHVQSGIADGVLGRPAKVPIETYGPKVQELAASRVAAVAAAEKKAGAAFLEKEAAQPGAKKQPTGFVYNETKAGTGAAPKPTDRVKVHYRGTFIDGKVFDSSLDRGEPVTFPVTGVIPCWTQGLQLMKEGGSARLVCPSDLAYGDQGRPSIKGGATLVFEVQLLAIEKDAAAAAAPAPATKK